eukprot:Hpha_TRINITY_DN22365_c0_g1::TRINITY_DN22365_c0_g1_i1::g.177739::m.177739
MGRHRSERVVEDEYEYEEEEEESEEEEEEESEEEEDLFSGSEDAEKRLPPLGHQVEVQGLKQRKVELNSRVGKVEGYDETRRDGVVVRFGSELTKVLSGNLVWPTTSQVARRFPVSAPVVVHGLSARRRRNSCTGRVERLQSEDRPGDNRVGVALPHAPLAAGDRAIAWAEIRFDDGQSVARGTVGEVLRVPGEQPGSIAEVSMGGLEFDAQPGEVCAFEILAPRHISLRARTFEVSRTARESMGLRFFNDSIVLREVNFSTPAARAGVGAAAGHR